MAHKKFNELRQRLMAKPDAEDLSRKAKDQLNAEIERYEMTLRELRKAHEVTQAKLAKMMELSQPEVSRIERQPDLFLSTARAYVEALGGELSLIARFPDEPEVEISVGDLTPEPLPYSEPQRS
jgi:DNA-binding XRE family transcriptional regulator